MDPVPVWQPPPKFQDRRWLHALLFLLTIGSTVLFGTLNSGTLTGGIAYSATILAILGCHELGHYVACRYYDVDASLPFFLPFISLTGTLGAFIRIREPIPYKRWLFDIGIAGPIAGFVVAVPALFIGVAMSKAVPIASAQGGITLGDPLLMKLAAWVLFPSMTDAQTLLLHPVAFAAWFGLLATALNLFPIGQLDGGHISYAVVGPKSLYVTCAGLLAAVGLSLTSQTWIVWTVLTVALMVIFRSIRHPSVIDEDAPLGRARKVLAVVAAIIFVLCFTPVPIQF